MDKERLPLALLGTFIICLPIYLLSYWGPNYGETKTEALAPAEEVQPERPGEAPANKTETEGRGTNEPKRDKAGSSKTSETGSTTSDRPATRNHTGIPARAEREKEIPPGLGSRKANNESAAGTDQKLTAASEEELLDWGDKGRGSYDPGDLTYLGNFRITAYTAGPESTGKTPDHPEYGITYSGLPVEKGVTAAADLNVLPLGSIVFIEGVGRRTIQDKGGAVKGNHLDIYIPNLDRALTWGSQKRAVYLIKRGGE